VASEKLGYTKSQIIEMSPTNIVDPDKRSGMPENAVKLLMKA